MNKLKDTPSSAQIKDALEKANVDQVQAIASLKQDQNDALTPELDLLQANVEAVQTATQAITATQTPKPAVGGKRRRRTRSKGKKYHKRTKRGGYPYGKGNGNGKGNGKKKS